MVGEAVAGDGPTAMQALKILDAALEALFHDGGPADGIGEAQRMTEA